jgi:hypothetical protein
MGAPLSDGLFLFQDTTTGLISGYHCSDGLNFDHSSILFSNNLKLFP